MGSKYGVINCFANINECQVLCGDAGLQMPCIPDDATNLAFMTQVATEVNNQAFLGLRFSGGAWSWPAGCGADYGTYNNWYGSAPSGAEGDCVWNRYYNQWYAVPGDGGNGGYGDAYCYCQVVASLAPTREPTAAPTRNIPP